MEGAWVEERLCEPGEVSMSYVGLRQEGLPLRRLESVAIAGLGGVGSWVAVFLAVSRLVTRLELVDFDYLEPHNLNRTPYRPGDVCRLKTHALRELVGMVNPEINVVVYPYPLERVIDRLESSVLVEATDSLKLEGILSEWVGRGKELLRVHYDGEGFTLEYNHTRDWSSTGGGSGYSTAPVYVGTPVVAAGLAVHLLLWEETGIVDSGAGGRRGFFLNGTLTGLLEGGYSWRV